MQPAAHAAISPRSQPKKRTSDQALLVGLGRGDPSAASAFVHQFQGRAYGLARSILRDPTLAEDVAQEALIRVWRKAGSYDSRRGSVSTWVLTITRNLALDSLRRKGAQPTDPRALIFLDQPAHGSVPEDAATLADETNRVKTVLFDLPVEQRRALVLAAFYGYTAREIGRAEAIPLGTAKSRVRSGLKKVRSSLVHNETPLEGGAAHYVGRRLPSSIPITSNR
jgi:RNA polymerase sigma factor (sigma-70 family)